MKNKLNRVFSTIGICGGGKMGVSFYNHIYNLGYDIVFYARNLKNLEKLQKRYLKDSQKEIENSSTVLFTDRISDLADTDIIFEFVSESLQLKREIIDEMIKERKNQEQIIATVSSSITPSRININYGENNIVGVHFIYPVQFMKSVEIIYGEKTDMGVLNNVVNLIAEIDKNPIKLREEADIFSTKILSAIQNEAFRIHKEYNLDPEIIDNIIVEKIAMPPFDMMDSVGMDIILTCLHEFYYDTEEYEYIVDLQEFLIQKIILGQSGKKAGKGFFDYSDGQRKSIGEYITDIDTDTAKIIIDRVNLVYINACFRYLDNCWLDSIEIDSIISEVNQLAKGPIERAFEMGLEDIMEALKIYEKKYGIPFKTTKLLEYAVRHNLRRDEIDSQIRLFRMEGRRPDWDNNNNG